MRLGVLPPQVMRVVGGDDADPQLLAEGSIPSATTFSSAMPCCWISSQKLPGPNTRENHSALLRASSYRPWRSARATSPERQAARQVTPPLIASSTSLSIRGRR